MDVEQARLLARRLIDHHGLSDWSFEMDRAKRRFGCCWRKIKLITLSEPLTKLNELAEVQDTILHEIAHALVPGGHTPAWKRKCREIGAKPFRCYSGGEIRLPELKRRFRYVATCRCPIDHFKSRKPTSIYICRRCRQKLQWGRVEISVRSATSFSSTAPLDARRP